MKKTISLLLALLLITTCFAFHSPDANALGAVWVKEYYTDKFGDKTEQFYITNKSQFKGTYNSGTGSKGKIGADLIFERDGEKLLAIVTLFIKGKDQVVNSSSAVQYYDIAVKKPDGNEFATSAEMQAGEGRMIIKDALEFMRVMASGDISIYIEEKGNQNSNYLFHTKKGNFEELFAQEIWLPYQEMRYQKAEELLNSKQFDAAVKAFQDLGDYRDSTARVAEVIEAKNADAYAKADELLQQKEYDAAVKAFQDLGDYRDSTARVAEVIEAQNADAYATAKTLLEEKKFDEAISILRELSDYKDSPTVLAKAKEDKQEYAYENACRLFDEGSYEEASMMFTLLSDYKDSTVRLEECQKAATFVEAITKLNRADFEGAYKLFSSLGDYGLAQDYVENFYYYIVKSETKNNESYDKDLTDLSEYKYTFDEYGRISTCEILTQQKVVNFINEYTEIDHYYYTDNGLLERIETESSGKMTTVSFIYSENGGLEKKVSESPETIETIVYDEQGREKSLTIHRKKAQYTSETKVIDGVITKQDVKLPTEETYSIEYDADGKIISNTMDERPGYEAKRDGKGRIIIEHITGDTFDRTISYIYDEIGNCVRVITDEHVNEPIYKDSITVNTYKIGYNSFIPDEAALTDTDKTNGEIVAQIAKAADSHGFTVSTGELLRKIETLLTDANQSYYIGDNATIEHGAANTPMLVIKYNPGEVYVVPFKYFHADKSPESPDSEDGYFTYIWISGVDQYNGFDMSAAIKNVCTAVIYLTKEDVLNYSDATRFCSKIENNMNAIITDGPLDYMYSIGSFGPNEPYNYNYMIRDHAAYN